MSLPAEATREIYWNISNVWLMYALALPALAVAGFGLYRHFRLWRQGLPLGRFDRPYQRLRLALIHAFIQSRTAKNLYSGFFHRLIFYGFIILALATTVVALDADFGTTIMRGPFYLYFQSFAVDLFGALVMVGIMMAFVRRYFTKPRQLVYSGEAGLILLIVFVILATGFVVEGWRIAVTNDPWGAWSPFGNLAANAFRRVMSANAMQWAHRITWWFHLVLSLGFLAWIPYSKMMHLVTAPINIYTANLDPIGAALKSVDFESAESFGVNSLKRFTWKDLLDLDACTECGRCTAACPANTVGKALSPRDIILQLRDLMHSRTHEAFGIPANHNIAGVSGDRQDRGSSVLPIIGTVPATLPEALWQCTTCAACMEECPVFIEQMPKIVDMRRHLVMEEAEYPETMQEAIASLESRGHPFRGTQATRIDWTEGLGISRIGDAREADVLFYVGCSGALVERNQKVVRATAKLLQQAGIRFSILGREEKCCGDPARRIGNEFLFEMLAKDNIADFDKHGIKRIVTACPHCYNTIRNEYPRYGGHFEVHHHSEYLASLLKEGRIKLRSASSQRITFHDPCYLGRHNGVYDAPRDLALASSREGLIEMPRSKAKGFCCGGGGGGSFQEEPLEQRVNRERALEALATGANVLGVACPFCMTMMEDGVASCKNERELRVMDIAELLWQSAADPAEM